MQGLDFSFSSFTSSPSSRLTIDLKWAAEHQVRDNYAVYVAASLLLGFFAVGSACLAMNFNN